ncbi:MAG TPA: helix-turn-helix domain-containing protein [Actinophytocola sp.]|uniref:nSTAND1 domain-containing NTPase n=1 Tax=Actinophytocola sp. TaxID=1872138 RepID=UPI002DBC88B8|nr:helix-turn-helix domain-containing protein [Actinophytocola sp.]HEU5473785.1 helix-turn-helix domain-containing protein [Actinophytocola sp.]
MDEARGDPSATADSLPDPRMIATPEGFARSLRVLRNRTGLSLRTVKQQLDRDGNGDSVSVSTLSDWFTGRHLPTPKLTRVLPNLLSVCGERDPDVVREWIIALERVRISPGPRPSGTPAPYLGLSSYAPENAEVFFGRRILIAELVALAHRAGQAGHPTIVIGPSGSGKSSLLRAGLIPEMCHASENTLARRRYVLLTPGSDPMDALANAIAHLTEHSAELIHKQLIDDPQSTAQAIKSACEPGELILIVVDQFEELFSSCRDEMLQHAFVRALCALAKVGAGEKQEENEGLHVPAPVVLVAIGMRADFYAHVLAVRLLDSTVQNAQLVVRSMSEVELREAITGPARAANLSLEPGLVELLVNDLAPRGQRLVDGGAAHEPGALPLLSHALLTTWSHTRGRVLTAEAYRASGGIHGAVAQTAEAAYAGLRTDDEREIARRLFLSLVRTDDDITATRRRMPYADLRDSYGQTEPDEFQQVLDQFIVARLITIDDDAVEVSHEALLSAWPRLREWLDADAAWRRIHRRLDGAARHWNESDRNPDLLYRGAALETTREWLEGGDRHRELNSIQRAFLDASVAQRAADKERARRRVRRRYQVATLMAVLVILAAGIGIYAQQLKAIGDRERAQATVTQAEGLSRLVASKADRLRDRDVPLSMQLALAAYRIAPTPEARSSLLNSTSVPAATRMLSPRGAAHAVTTNGNGTLVAAALDGGPIQLWTPSNGERLVRAAVLEGATGTLFSVALSRDGRLLAAGGRDKMVHLWDTTDPAKPIKLGALARSAGELRSVAVSPDGQSVAAAGTDKTVFLWDVKDPTHPALAAALTGPTDTVRAVAFSPDSRILAAGGHDSVIHLWNVDAAGKPAPRGELTGPSSKIFSLAFSLDGHMLAAGTGAEHNVYLWNISDGGLSLAGPPLTGPASWVNAVTFSPDGRRAAVASSDNLVWLFDLQTRQPTIRLPHPNTVESAVFRNDHSLLTVAEDGAVRHWALPGPVITGARDSVFNLSFDAAGARLAIAPGVSDNTATVWNTTDRYQPTLEGTPLMNAPDLAKFAGTGAITPDGKTYIAGCIDGTFQIWDISNPERPFLVGAPFPAAKDLLESITPNKDGNLLAVSADDNTVRLFDISERRHPKALGVMTGTSSAGFFYQAAFSPNGQLLAAANSDRQVYLYDVTNQTAPRLLATLGGFADAAYSVAFNANGNILAAGGADNTVRLWDVRHPGTPQSIGQPLTGPVGIVYSIAFDPNRDVLAAGSTDATIWLWDLTRPQQPDHIATLTGPTKGVLSVAIDPSGRRLAASGHDRTVRLWNTDPNAAATWICDVVGDPITAQEWTQYIPEVPYTPPCP